MAAGELGRGLVPAALGPVEVGRPVQVHQDGQRPGAGSEREPDEHGQHDPAVPVPPGGVGVGRADRVPVPGLPVHARPRVAVHCVVADQADRAVGDQVVEQEPCEGAAEFEPGPLGGRQDPLVAGPVAGGQPADGAEEVGHGPPAGGQDSGCGEGQEPGVRRVGEVRGEGGQQRPGVGG